VHGARAKISRFQQNWLWEYGLKQRTAVEPARSRPYNADSLWHQQPQLQGLRGLRQEIIRPDPGPSSSSPCIRKAFNSSLHTIYDKIGRISIDENENAASRSRMQFLPSRRPDLLVNFSIHGRLSGSRLPLRLGQFDCSAMFRFIEDCFIHSGSRRTPPEDKDS
jgi:hypothetical protein